MWPFKKKIKIPDFGFRIELVKNEGNQTIYAGYGIRVIEITTGNKNTKYQLRVKDKSLLQWVLKGTFKKPEAIRRRVHKLPPF